MANIISMKQVKIKPENEVIGQGVVTKCKYSGSSSVGIGPFAKKTDMYKVFIEVEGIEKPLVLKVKEKAGWNASIVHEISSIGKMFGKHDLPINVGDTVTIAYDKIKPKKCNIVENETPTYETV